MSIMFYETFVWWRALKKNTIVRNLETVQEGGRPEAVKVAIKLNSSVFFLPHTCEGVS